MGLSNKYSCESGSCSCCHNPQRCSQSLVLRLYFPALEPWVVWSVSLPSCYSWFIYMRMWNCPVCQAPPCLPWPSSLCLAVSPLCLAACLCPYYRLGVSSLIPWLSDFCIVQFSGSFACFLFLNLLLFFFWLCEEVPIVLIFTKIQLLTFSSLFFFLFLFSMLFCALTVFFPLIQECNVLFLSYLLELIVLLIFNLPCFKVDVVKATITPLNLSLAAC